MYIRDVQKSIIFDPADPTAKKEFHMPKSNVLQFFLEGGTVVSARPSGTEPKIKFYINCTVPAAGGTESVLASARREADTLCNAIASEINTTLDAAQ